MNKAILIGRLGNDPETKTMNSGDSVCNFSLATSEKWTKDGQKQEKTEWHKITAYRKLADVCGNFLEKGSQIYVEGKITYREWQDKEGQKRVSTEIIADKVEVLGSGKSKGGENRQPKPAGDDGEEIPF